MEGGNAPQPEELLEGELRGCHQGLAMQNSSSNAASAVSLTTPKVFISYSWTSEQHEEWVIELATRLMQDGVQAIFDKWDLKVGHDANAFMESMVTDPTVTKVLLVCDATYAAKADGRMGGVGKEAQILTREIYEKAGQDKYAALITERDQDGKAITPVYYGGRQYIDFSRPELAETAYEELLRWIWNKPRYEKPRLGQAPAFITNPDAVSTGTTSKFKRAENAIKSGNAAAPGFISEFGEALVAEFRERAPNFDTDHRDEAIITAAVTMRPALRHLNEIVLAEARFSGAGFDRVLRIFEQMGRLMYRPANVNEWSEGNFDTYRMMCYEGFLAATAILVQEQRFDLLGQAVRHAYLIEGRDWSDGPTTTTFRVFAQDLPSFEMRKRRLQSRQYDLYSDLISELYAGSFPSLDNLIEADILLHLRSMIVKDGNDYENWWPRMIIYAPRFTARGLWARSESLSFFSDWFPKVFGPMAVSEFQTVVRGLADQFKGIYGFPGPNLAALTNLQHIGSRP